jgi:hypothetical protein
MAAIAGVLLFDERASLVLYSGVALTIFGLTLMHAKAAQNGNSSRRSDAAPGGSEDRAEAAER